VILRERERALREVQRVESEGAAMGPAVTSYRNEVLNLDP